MATLRMILERELPATPFGEKMAAALERQITEHIAKLFDQAAEQARKEPCDDVTAYLLGYIRGGLQHMIGDHVELSCAPETWAEIAAAGKAVR